MVGELDGLTEGALTGDNGGEGLPLGRPDGFREAGVRVKVIIGFDLALTGVVEVTLLAGWLLREVGGFVVVLRIGSIGGVGNFPYS